MDFLIETDLGHDPDDLFTICHLVEAGHRVLALGLVPGSPEQVALAYGLRAHLGLDCEIGTAKPSAKPERLGVHDQIRRRFGWLDGAADGSNAEVFARAIARNPDADLLAIGPAPGLGKVAAACRGRLMFQGGFLPYSLHRPASPVAAFEGKDSVPTFNFNGCRDAVDALLAAPLASRRFCGKNVCHSVLLTPGRAAGFAAPRHAAGEVYLLAVRLYLEKHGEKKMHDPTALACHLYPEIGTWLRGRPQRLRDGWTTMPTADGDHILADVDHAALWDCLRARR